MSMIGAVHTAWLFTRGSESVRIIRVALVTGDQQLLVTGPGTEISVYRANDAMECVRHQSELERRLVGKGFRLERFLSGERRRRKRDRRTAPRGSERRQYLSRVI